MVIVASGYKAPWRAGRVMRLTLWMSSVAAVEPPA